MFALLPGCAQPLVFPEGRDMPWTREQPRLEEVSPAGRAWRRGIIHLHSIWSHDACDNHEGDLTDEQCLADFRDGLCASGIDYAFLTDHPAMAAEHPYEDLLLLGAEDEVIDGVANRMRCADGSSVLLMPGIEDELMPVGLDRHVSDDDAVNEDVYNRTDAEAMELEVAAGATILQAHTEGKSLLDLFARQTDGLAGVEIFNLHAMVDPTKREEDLGLDAFGYIDAISPWLDPANTAEPDLVFLGFYEQQDVSLERWDALNGVGHMVGTAGTDAHQNALPQAMADGERMDSYRRMTRWFSNVLLVDGDAPADHQAALALGRGFVAFDALGIPSGFDVHYGPLEMGGEATVGDDLVVSCPVLATRGPYRGDAPDISVTVLKDGLPFATGCGRFPLVEAGVYRVRVDITPHHLAGFLADQADTLVHPYPWLYSNAFRIGL